VGFSSREANKISFFSTVAGGGLVGRGTLARRPRRASGAGVGGLIADVPFLAAGGVGAGSAATGACISGVLGTGFLVPGGGAGAAVGTI
jgi:hypothetical protein